jgi:hypothetical protein
MKQKRATRARDVDQRAGADDGRTGGMGGAQEDVVHALDGPRAVLGLTQVHGHDLGRREGGLQGLVVDGESQAGTPSGQREGEIGADEPGAPRD